MVCIHEYYFLKGEQMCYSIDIAFDPLDNYSGESLRREAILKAEDLSCEEVYWSYELEGDRVVRSSRCVVTASFPDAKKLSKFVSFARSKQGCHIEALVDTSGSPVLLYASRGYAAKMAKEKRDEYKQRKNNKEWTQEQERVLRSVRRR